MASQSFKELARWLRTTPPRLGSTRLVVVDGPAGAGKTTFAASLAKALENQPILHMDDLYEGWGGLGDDVWRRLHAVLMSLAASDTGRYRRYDWDEGRFAEWHEVSPSDVFIVEGVGAGHRSIDLWATLRVWVEAGEALRLERGLHRDGPALRDHWVRWMGKETAHFTSDDTRRRADLLIDGSTGSDASSYTVIEDRRPASDL